MSSADELEDEVRRHYAAAADTAAAGGVACCGPDAGLFGPGRYDDLAAVPEAASRASIGCGNPTEVADLRAREVVLDLGSGGGLDVLLSARRVGPTGMAYGVDFTPEMLQLARRNAQEAGANNVAFLEGRIDAVPLPDASVDVIVSNCVINLAVDKTLVFAEMRRLLRPGGRIGISDVVTEDRLSEAERAERGTYVGCVAGALSVRQYRDGLGSAGFTDVAVRFSHEVADGVYAAIIQATSP